MARHSPVLKALAALKLDYSPPAVKQRGELLVALGRSSLSSREVLLAHSLLLFLLAYPDSSGNLRLAQRALRQITKRAARLSSHRELLNSGILGTRCAYAFSIDLLAWLSERCRRLLTFDWHEASWTERMDDFLQSAVLRVSADVVLNGELSTQELVQLFSRKHPQGEVGWFAHELLRVASSGGVLDRAYDSLECSVEWAVKSAAQSLTGVRIGRARPSVVRSLHAPFDLREEVTRPLRSWRCVSSAEGRKLIDAARWTLALRGRETDPVTYANPQEIYRCSVGRGIEILLFTLLPERRLPIESYVGYVAARGGIPIAYGGAWLFGPRAEIGLNIFDQFRGGESAFLFAQLMRVYAQLFGATQFQVPPYQLGDDNEEGLHSGAYWFYYRLGFRPEDDHLCALAGREVRRRQRSSRYRSSTALMKRFVSEPVYWAIAPERKRVALDVARIGTAIAKQIGKQFGGDQRSAEEQAAVKLARVSSTPKRRTANHDSYRWFSPLLLLLGDLGRWSSAECRQLRRIFELKRAGSERDYVLAVQALPRLIQTLERVSSSD